MAIDQVSGTVGEIASTFTWDINPTLLLFLFTLLFMTYSLFFYFFSRSMAKKDIIKLNLSKYNTAQDPSSAKMAATFLYILEYILVIPVLSFFWFAGFSILFFVLVNGVSVVTILLVSAAIITTVRITAYVSSETSETLARAIPFTFFALAIVRPEFFSMNVFLGRIAEVPSILGSIFGYMVFIVSIEAILRFIEFISKLITDKKEDYTPVLKNTVSVAPQDIVLNNTNS
ncbi:MAG: hypothetical protein WCP89_01380 [archaeon]